MQLFLREPSFASAKRQFRPAGKPKTGKLPLFSDFHKHVSDLHVLVRLISLVSPPSCYPVATASASIRRIMLPNNRRVRWLSASISQ